MPAVILIALVVGCAHRVWPGAGIPYELHVAAGADTLYSYHLDFHDRVAAAVGLPRLSAAALPGGWREIRVSDATPDGRASTEESRPILNGVLWEMREEWVLQIVWAPDGVRGQVLQWWPAVLDSVRDLYRGPKARESRLDHGCPSSVTEAGSIRMCVLWSGSGDVARAVASALDTVAWGRPIRVREQRPHAPDVPQTVTMSDADSVVSIALVRVDTVYVNPYARRVTVERRDGDAYRFDHYSEFIGPSPAVDEWMTVLERVKRILRNTDNKRSRSNHRGLMRM